MNDHEIVKDKVGALNQVAGFVNATERTDSQILKRIESLELSADAKALLADLLKLTTRVGDHLLRIGRKVLDFVLLLMRQFPLLSFAALVAIVVAALLSAVPLLGGLLAPVLTPLALVLGVSWGAKLELETPDLAERVREFAAGFSGIES